jgi:hypothetical protein
MIQSTKGLLFLFLTSGVIRINNMTKFYIFFYFAYRISILKNKFPLVDLGIFVAVGNVLILKVKI